MRICFTNDTGSVIFGDSGQFRIIEIDGLDFISKNRNVTAYFGIDGQHCLSETADVRIITIKGDTKNDLLSLRRFVRVLSENGILKIGFSSPQKAINAVCTDLVLSDKGKAYKTFTVQFTADYPYFEDSIYSEKLLFMRNKLICSPFAFPLILSNRESQSSVVNVGDIKSEPIIEIRALTDGGGTNSAIVLENLTSGKQLTLRHKLTADEILTVDIPSRTITSSISGSVLSSLDDNSFLSDMMLERGENELRVTNGSGGEITVKCRFKNKYCQCLV